MADFSKFYTNNAAAASSNFKETFTVETIKATQGGAALNVRPCKENPSRCYFACGLIRGAVSQALADKLRKKAPHGNLVVSHVVNDGSNPDFPNKFDGLLLHEEGSATDTLLSI